MITLTDIEAALREAHTVQNKADLAAGQLADMLVGRLRKGVSVYSLTQLKNELRAWNCHTNTWRPAR